MKSVANLPPLVSIPMPLIIDLSSPAHTLPKLDALIEQTAAGTDLIAIMDSRFRPANDANLEHIAFYLGPDSPPVPEEILRKTRLVEIADSAHGDGTHQGTQSDASTNRRRHKG